MVGDEEVAGWIDLLNPVVYPSASERRQARPGVGCPEFGEDSVLERPPAVRRGPSASVVPGAHEPRSGSHDVVWWDPRQLQLDPEQNVGLRQQKILEADESGTVADAGVRAHEAWQALRRDALSRGARPTIVVEPVTALVARLGEEASSAATPTRPEVETLQVSIDRSDRPGGRRFGTLVHAALAVVDLGSDRQGVASAVRSQARLVGCSEDEIAAARVAVEAALAHPLLRRAAQSHRKGGLRRETPMLLRRADGSLAEGVVDLAFREAAGQGAGAGDQSAGERWVVVDFKTDRELGARRAEYEAQVLLYAEGVAAATGLPTHPVLLVV